MTAVLLGRAHRDEMHGRVGDLGDVRAESESAARGRRCEDLRQAGLEERRDGSSQALDPGGVDIDPDDLVSEFCHGGGVDSPQVTAADHGNLHVALSFR